MIFEIFAEQYIAVTQCSKGNTVRQNHTQFAPVEKIVSNSMW